jgi:hypothetical protein
MPSANITKNKQKLKVLFGTITTKAQKIERLWFLRHWLIECMQKTQCFFAFGY